MQNKFRSFEDARKFVQKLELKNKREWQKYCRTNKKPSNIPTSPNITYKKQFLGYGDWLGTGNVASVNKKYFPFEKSRDFVRALKLKNSFEWKKYCKIDNKPNFIPSTPGTVYRKDWKGFGDWLGTGNVRPSPSQFLTFKQARKFTRSLRLSNVMGWKQFCKSATFPPNIPKNPLGTYKNKGWISYGDWLGTNTIASQKRKFRNYSSAKLFVSSLKLKGQKDWRKYIRLGKLPQDIPKSPNHSYANEWISWGDWLGTGTIHPKNRNLRSFDDARKYARSLGLKSHKTWLEFCISGKKPKDIPTYPNSAYKENWKHIGDWLGIKTPHKFREFRNFKDAREFVHSLNLTSGKEWKNYCKSTKKPEDIPTNPNIQYKKDWKGWGDWLGTGIIAFQNKDWLPWKIAKLEYQKIAKENNLKNKDDWLSYLKNHNLPENLPRYPESAYSKEKIGRGVD